MKLALIFLGTLTFLFLIAYLLGSFASATFDISKWEENTRHNVASLGGFFGIIIASGLTALLNENK